MQELTWESSKKITRLREATEKYKCQKNQDIVLLESLKMCEVFQNSPTQRFFPIRICAPQLADSIFTSCSRQFHFKKNRGEYTCVWMSTPMFIGRNIKK